MKDAKFHWAEVIPPGSVQQSTQSYGSDFGSRVLTIQIDWMDLQAFSSAIAYIVGYSECLKAGSNLTNPVRFDPANPALQGPYILARKPPARHPQMPNLRATKIVSVQGKGLRSTVGGAAGGNVAVGDGFYGNWQFAEVSILFEIPKYPILSEEEMTVSEGNSGVPVRSPEYRRYVEWFFDASVETQARKGVTWSFSLAAAAAQQQSFNGDRLLRQAKGILKAKWYDVHQDFVMLGHLIPTNFFKRHSTLNARAFPQDAYRDQNVPLVPVGPLFSPPYTRFGPGTLLLLPMKSQAHAQCHPAVLKGEISPVYFPRTLDLEITWLAFDPTCNDTTTVNLSNSTYGAAIPAEGIQFSSALLPADAAAATYVRGHNLAPLVKPLNGFSWFAVQNNTMGAITQVEHTSSPGFGLTVITSVAHGLVTGQTVLIRGVNTPIITLDEPFNSAYVVTVMSENKFSLNGLIGGILPRVNTVSGGTFRSGYRIATVATAAGPVVVTSVAHGLVTGQTVRQSVFYFTIQNLPAAIRVVTVLTADTFSLDGTNAAGFGVYNASYDYRGYWSIGAPALVSDTVLLHPYSDHEKLFGAVESL